MNSIFIRIYGWMLASMLLVGVISYIVIVQSNAHFNRAYHEALLKGSFRLLVNGMARLQGQARTDWYELAKTNFDMDLKIKSPASAPWPDALLDKIRKDQIVIKNSEDAIEVFASLPTSEALIVYARLQAFTERQIRGAARQILEELKQYQPVEWETALTRTQDYFGFPVQRRDAAQLHLDARQYQRLANGDALLLFTNTPQNLATLRVAVAIPGEQDYLVLGPVNLFDWLPYHLFLICGLVAIFILGLTSYVLVKPMLMRLNRLEETVVKIRRDDLSARVMVDSNDALGRLASTFNDMAEHIQRLINSQREMTNAVSHELRTPVARIRFGLEMVEDTDDYESRRNQIQDIDNDIQELEKLIDEILTYASLEEGTPSLNLQMVEIDAILNQVKKETDALGRKVEIEHVPSREKGELRLAECEERYIHRVVQNLVGNATNYARSRVRISSACEGGMVRVDVEDDGPGIPPDKWEKVFVPFARLDDSRTRATGGYGLGLSIVQRIAYWHGGVASVYRSNIGGAKFTIIWPRRQALRKTLSENLKKQKTEKKRFWLQRRPG